MSEIIDKEEFTFRFVHADGAYVNAYGHSQSRCVLRMNVRRQDEARASTLVVHALVGPHHLACRGSLKNSVCSL
jgi:hypothetical protein